MQRRELEAARADETGEYTYPPAAFEFAGANLQVIDGERELFPGMRIIPTPGHTAGHQVLLLDTERGRIVFAGQAVNFASDYSRALFQLELANRGIEQGDHPEWTAYLESMRPWRIYFAHDLTVWQRDAESWP